MGAILEAEAALAAQAATVASSVDASTATVQYSSRKDKIVAAFAQWDTEGNGTISKEDFSQVWASVNVVLPRHVIDAALANSDANRDGAIDYAEFFEWLCA